MAQEGEGETGLEKALAVFGHDPVQISSARDSSSTGSLDRGRQRVSRGVETTTQLKETNGETRKACLDHSQLRVEVERLHLSQSKGSAFEYLSLGD